MNLTFDNFELELPNEITGGCWWKDYVEIIVAPNSNGQMYCGSLPCLASACSAPAGTFSGTTITIKFHSDGADNMHGFLAVVCCSVNVTSDMTGYIK